MSGIVGLQGRVGNMQLLGNEAGAPDPLGSMAWDDATGAGGAFQDADTKLDDQGATAVEAADFDSYVTDPDTGVTTLKATLPKTSSLDGTELGRYSLHFGPASGVSLSSTTLFGGVDQQSHVKNNDHAYQIEIDLTPSDQS